jgi:hypothetical protein
LGLLTLLTFRVGLTASVLSFPRILGLPLLSIRVGIIGRLGGLLAFLLGSLALGARPVRVVLSTAAPGLCRQFLAGCLGDLAVNLICEIFELALCSLQRSRFVAKNALGRPFDALAQLFNSLASELRRLGGILGHTKVDQLPGDFQGVGDLLFGRLSDRVVQALGQERLGFLGVLDGAAHLIHDLVETLLLLIESLVDLFAFGRVAQGMLLTIVGGIKLFGELLLILVQTSRLGAHVGHFLGESIRGILSKLLAHVV